MNLRQRFHAAIIMAGLCVTATLAEAQASDAVRARPSMSSQPSSVSPESAQTAGLSMSGSKMSSQRMSGQRTAAASSKPSPGETVTPQQPFALAARSGARSMLDEPAAPARIQVSGDRLSINANNASLSEVIRQVATDTGMQVEGNSRDERVFGSYGPGSPPEVLSALLYDSGYNVIMVGSTADGAPRRLVLSARVATAAASAQSTAAPPRSNDEDEEEPQTEAPQSPPSTVMQSPSGVTPAPGQPRTPQQMFEELQRMHQGQQPQEAPHE